MKQSKIIWLYLLLISLCPALHSQNKVTYGYDAAGNRISRTIVLSPTSAPAPTVDEPVVYTETFADIKLKIYPNPTNGLVKVEIYNLPKGQTANIRLYAMSGKLITTLKNVSDAASINLSGQPAGIYLMNIVAGDFRTEWKIIKK